MAEEKPSLHIDTDWKKQAQEEKRNLAEAEKKRQEEAAARTPSAAATIPGPGAGAGGPAAAASRAGQRGSGEMPEASFPTLVQSIVTQVLFYLGDITPRGGEPTVSLDLAKHHIDTLNLLEAKTKGNLTEQELKMLDAALYETRMRFVSVAQQYIP